MADKVKPDDDAKPVKEPKSPAAPSDKAATPAGTDQAGRQLYDVVCAACGKQTQVPFKPTGDRPVYCRDCYMKQRG
jgi:CxxC-x17-CxxC domain-containing protein